MECPHVFHRHQIIKLALTNLWSHPANVTGASRGLVFTCGPFIFLVFFTEPLLGVLEGVLLL